MSSEKEPAGGALLGALDSETAHHPQAMYSIFRENAPVMKDEATGVVVSRAADIERILQDPELFSSGKGAPSFGNVRPMIPLQIDPPEHRSFRKLLNPLFSLQRMAELEESMTTLVNELIDAFIDEREIDFVGQFSQVFPSQVFLTMLGLSMDELPELLEMKDGIIRPHLKVGAEMFSPEANEYRDATGLKVYEYFSRVLDQLVPGGEGLLSRLLDTEIDGERLSREDVLDVCFVFLIAGLDTVSASLECFFSYLADNPTFRAEILPRPRVDPERGRRAAALGDTGHGGGSHRDRGHRDRWLPCGCRRADLAHHRVGEHGRRGHRPCTRGAVGSHPEPTRGLRRRHPPLPWFASRSSRAARRPA